MTAQKKRILFVGEASFLSTGFATYYRELLPRLAATGKYEIAELGSYARQDHPDVQNFIKGRWKFYGAMPTNPEEEQIFNQLCPDPRTKGQNTNQFGEWKFNGVVADFKPDFVIDIRDWWMLEFQERSAFRDWFKWIVMPTVDAEPQQEEWIKTYENANLVLTYSDYGVHTLQRQSVLMPNGKRRMKIFPTPMRPGVDLETFKPLDKKETRDLFNLNKDIPIVGTVMRNQSRKLYPDLIDAFALMKNKYAGNKRVDDATLLLHSCWPDNQHSYDYPRHIMRLESYEWMPNHKKGIRGDILQSMKCFACGELSWTYAMNLHNQPIQDKRIKMPCPHCQKQECSPPNTAMGYTREELAKLYNLMDVYVQCSICEGDGMPIQEAKACGVPTLVTDYSAMSEKGRFPSEYSHFKDVGITEANYTCHKGGEAIDIDRYYYEPETSCKRALVDIEDLSEKLFNMVSNEDHLKDMSVQARECVEENYDWNVLFSNWENVLDNIKPLDRSVTWDSPIESVPDFAEVAVPNGLTDEQYVEWLYVNILKYPTVDPNGAVQWIQYLKQGVTREVLMKQFVSIGNQQSDAHKVRQQIRAQVDGVVASPQKALEQEWM